MRCRCGLVGDPVPRNLCGVSASATASPPVLIVDRNHANVKCFNLCLIPTLLFPSAYPTAMSPLGGSSTSVMVDSDMSMFVAIVAWVESRRVLLCILPGL